MVSLNLLYSLETQTITDVAYTRSLSHYYPTYLLTYLLKWGVWKSYRSLVDEQLLWAVTYIYCWLHVIILKAATHRAN